MPKNLDENSEEAAKIEANGGQSTENLNDKNMEVSKKVEQDEITKDNSGENGSENKNTDEDEHLESREGEFLIELYF